MFRSAQARQIVGGLSLVLMLLCQTMAAALGYAHAALAPAAAPAQIEGMNATAPCHQEALDANSGAPDQGCQDRCPSRDAAFESSTINIPVAASLALSAFSVNALNPAAATVTARYQQIVARAAPPPLRLLYCRLLN